MNLIKINMYSEEYRNLVFELGHINVFMGTNGVGKSRILKEIANHGNYQGAVKYVEGGRAVLLTQFEPTQNDFGT